MPYDNKNNPLLKSEFSNRSYGALWRLVHPALLRHGFWVVAALALAMCCLASVAIAAEATKPAAEIPKAAAPTEAPLVVWNQPITVFRTSFAGLGPQERAAQAAERIQALPLKSEGVEIKFDPAKIGAEEGVVLSVNSRPLFFLTAGDLVPDSNQTLNAAGQTAVTALRTALRARPQDQSLWSTYLMNIARVLIATLLLLGLLWAWRRIRIGLLTHLENAALLPERYLRLLAVDLRMHILQGGRAAIHLISAAVILVLGYGWLVYSLEQFPHTAPVGEKLAASLAELFFDLGRGALVVILGLVAVLIIILIARWSVRLINTVFKEIETGRFSLPWVEKGTQRTTQTLLIVAVWLFALVVAYPYIPGSDTQAFKAVSILIGLMIALGSAGLINQIISGLCVVYSKSISPEDFVRVGDVEGEVVKVGFLATKLRTFQQEEITLPHSMLVGAATTNYSRWEGEEGMAVTVSVTFDYNVPWRQVHALLLLGASRTQGIRQEPPPRVMQRGLSDFYVQYLLLAHLEDPKSRAAVLSDLQAQIQDAFMERGSQFLSPHFDAAPKQPVLEPKSDESTPPPLPPTAEMSVEPSPVETREIELNEIQPRDLETTAVDPPRVERKEIETREIVRTEPPAKSSVPSEKRKADRKRHISPRSPRAKPPTV
jgi:small-conductance mechanosensitive channel